jgi:hypothetical protein
MRKNHVPIPASYPAEGGTDFERIALFSDAIFLVKADLSMASIRYIFRRGMVTIVIVLLAVAAAYVSMSLALGLWLVFIAVTVPLSRLYPRLLDGPH